MPFISSINNKQVNREFILKTIAGANGSIPMFSANGTIDLLVYRTTTTTDTTTSLLTTIEWVLGSSKTFTGTNTFSAAVVLSVQATTTTHAVRADRNISTSTGLLGGGNLTADRTLSIDTTYFNTNYQAKGNYVTLDTVQTITGLKTIQGNLTMIGSIIPSANITYDLGSPTKMWKDVYIGPGSLYINGKKVIEDVSDTINITTTADQNLAIKTSGMGNLQIASVGAGNVELYTNTGLIQLKGNVMFESTKLIRTSDGNPFKFDDSITFSAGEGITGGLKVTGLAGTTSNRIIVADSSGVLSSQDKILTSQLPDSVLGQVSYQGTYNATTNTPTLATTPDSTTKGNYYVISSAGTRFTHDFQVGDWIISDGTKWDKVDNTDAVTTVFGRTGAVTLQLTDIPASSDTSYYLRGDRTWQPVPTQTVYATLESLTDTSITNPSGSQLLSYNGVSWVNWTPNFLTSESDTLATVTGRPSGNTTSTAISITNATVSSSTTTGALIVTGGTGVAGAVNIGGITTIHSTTASTSTTTGALQSKGGLGVAGAVNIGGITIVHSTTASTSTITGALQSKGGLGVAGAVWIGGLVNIASTLTVTGATTLSSSITTGLGTGIVKSTSGVLSSSALVIGDLPTGTTSSTVALGNHTHDLSGLTDATITTPATNQLLQWNGTKWVNWTPTYISSYSETDTLATVTGRGATTATAVSITNATASTSSTTGALVVTGGVGIGGALYAGSIFDNGLRVLTSYTETDTLQSVTGRGATTTNLVEINRTGLTINTTTPGTTKYNLHFGGVTTNDHAEGITWGGSGSATSGQAGIYVQSSTGYGTKMYFGTTSSYATGSVTRMLIDSTGFVSMTANLAATSTITGTLRVTGGVGVTGALYAGSLFDNGIRVLTSESDTLASVTGRGATTATAVSITNSTASSSTATGALIVTGGVGIGGAINNGSTIRTADGTAALPAFSWTGDTDTGVYRIGADQIGISTGGTVRITQSTTATVISTATTLSSTLGVTGATTLSSTLGVAGITSITNSTASSSTTTGALIVTGGVGIGGALNVGGTALAANYTVSSVDGNGLGFWGSTSAYKIHMSLQSNATWGGRLDTTSDYNMYFRMSGGTNRGFVFQNGTTSTASVAQIDGVGNIYAKGIVDVAGFKKNGSDVFVDMNNISNGSILAIEDIPHTEKVKLEDPDNWTGHRYSGSPLIGCLQGTEYDDGIYLYRFVQDNTVRRMMYI
jgi:fibronectin-binding autotransporter adhesin